MWRDRAACRGKPPEWWHIDPTGADADQVNRAAAGVKLHKPPKEADFPLPLLCKQCSDPFLPLNGNERYCSDVCRTRSAYLSMRARKVMA